MRGTKPLNRVAALIGDSQIDMDLREALDVDLVQSKHRAGKNNRRDEHERKGCDDPAKNDGGFTVARRHHDVILSPSFLKRVS